MSDLTLSLLKLLPLVIILGATFYFRRGRIRREKADDATREALNRYLGMAEAAADLDDEAGPDWRALRAAYLDSPIYVGRSRFNERDTVQADSQKAISTALLLLDFPLLSTQMDAAEYFKQHPEELGAEAHDLCLKRFHQLAQYIEETGHDSPEGRIYPVLSVDEEYAFLLWRGLVPPAPEVKFERSLVEIDGKRVDRFEIGDQVVLFDTSAFFERQALAALEEGGGLA